MKAIILKDRANASPLMSGDWVKVQGRSPSGVGYQVFKKPRNSSSPMANYDWYIDPRYLLFVNPQKPIVNALTIWKLIMLKREITP